MSNNRNPSLNYDRIARAVSIYQRKQKEAEIRKVHEVECSMGIHAYPPEESKGTWTWKTKCIHCDYYKHSITYSLDVVTQQSIGTGIADNLYLSSPFIYCLKGGK